MSYPPSSSPSRTAASSRFRRAGACAAVLLASAAALFSAGASPAVAAPAEQDQIGAVVQPRSKARVTAAVLGLDEAGREPVLYGRDDLYDTASIVKVDILAALLLQAQDEGRQLTARERALAEPMIRTSDNEATSVLWRKIGRAPGLEAANRRLGLVSTKGGPGGKWGLTQTTASDQIRLLRAVFAPAGTSRAHSSPLNAQSRAYIQSLMSRVAKDQAWGVSAASDTEGALKNGWLQRTTSGLWDVNSIGRITVDGRPCLVAVLSDGSASMRDGVSLVERTARRAVAAARR